jgi:hypothetical protein
MNACHHLLPPSPGALGGKGPYYRWYCLLLFFHRLPIFLSKLSLVVPKHTLDYVMHIFGFCEVGYII